MGTSESRTSRRRTWAQWVPWLVLVVGIVVSVASAVTRYTFVAQRDDEVFDSTAANVQAIAATQLARQEDLLGSLAGMMAATPDMTNAEFLRWYQTAGIAERFPGGIGVTYIERVASAELATFSAEQVTDPITGLVASDPFVVVPPRDAAQYCLMRLGVWEVDEVAGFPIPEGLDFCAPEMIPGVDSYTPPVIGEATDDATVALVPIADLAPGVLAEFLPVYAGGDPPATVDGRRAAVIGWVAASFDANAIVELAAAGQSDLAVAVDRTTSDGVERVASTGDLSAAGHTTTLPVSDDSRWRVTVVQAGTSQGVSATSQAVLVLGAAMTITLLLFVLLRVLIGQRERALAMVRSKTEQLEFAALHDALTGLPNRALILDRAAQMLARQGRTGEPVAALFVDLDDFKAVNDSHGHAAGDVYLCAVADRLASLFREADTVGRLGGDEFVILVETDREGAAAEGAAHRVLDALGRGVSLGEQEVPVNCSIGVAYGSHRTAEDLLDAADHAMYQAKTGGKATYVMAPSLDRARPDSAR
jgi:diguanylate cyclase (GGDEF)-like protein